MISYKIFYFFCEIYFFHFQMKATNYQKEGKNFISKLVDCDKYDIKYQGKNYYMEI